MPLGMKHVAHNLQRGEARTFFENPSGSLFYFGLLDTAVRFAAAELSQFDISRLGLLHRIRNLLVQIFDNWGYDGPNSGYVRVVAQ